MGEGNTAQMKWYTTRFIVLYALTLAFGLSWHNADSIAFVAIGNGALLALINHKHQETKQLQK